MYTNATQQPELDYAPVYGVNTSCLFPCPLSLFPLILGASFFGST